MSKFSSKIKIAATALVMLSFAATAQDMQGQSPQVRAAKQTKMMQKRLQLSADQTTAVNSINMSMANTMDSLTHSSADKKTIGKARKQMQANKEAQLQNVLTADQYKQYQAMEEERKQRMMQRRQMMQDGGGQNQNDMNN